jgi:hypothetical protein
MMVKTSLLALAVTMGLALCSDSARALSSGALLLVNVADARSTAVGDIGAADNSDPGTIFFNPANVISVSRVYFLGAQERFHFSDDLWIRRGRAGFSWQSKDKPNWTFGADAMYARLDYGEDKLTDTSGNLLGTYHSYEEAEAVALGAGFTAGDAYELRFGAAVKRWSAHFAPAEIGMSPAVEPDAMSFDAGAAIELHTRVGGWDVNPALGAAMMDVGPDFDVRAGQTARLPTRLNVGASVQFQSDAAVFSARVPLVSVLCQAEGVAPTDGDFEWGLGDEIAVAQILFLRTGVRRYISRTLANDPTYATWGVGIGIPAGPLRARFDYGRQANDYEKDHMGFLLEWVF